MVFDSYPKASKSPKYAKYMQDVCEMIPSMNDVNEPSSKLSDLLKDLGFEITFMQQKYDVFDYKTKLNYKSKLDYALTTNYNYYKWLNFSDTMKAINPFLSRMSIGLQNILMDDLADFVEEKRKHFAPENAWKLPYEIVYFIVTK